MDITLEYSDPDPTAGKDTSAFPGGDGGIDYNPDPIDYVKSELPKSELEDALNTMKQLFLNQWVRVFVTFYI